MITYDIQGKDKQCFKLRAYSNRQNNKYLSIYGDGMQKPGIQLEELYVSDFPLRY